MGAQHKVILHYLIKMVKRSFALLCKMYMVNLYSLVGSQFSKGNEVNKNHREIDASANEGHVCSATSSFECLYYRGFSIAKQINAAKDSSMQFSLERSEQEISQTRFCEALSRGKIALWFSLLISTHFIATQFWF